MNSLTQIGSDVRGLFCMQDGKINSTRGGKNYEEQKRQSLLENIALIQEAQNNLSHTTLRDVFSSEDNKLINPESLQLVYNSRPAMPMFYYVDIWSAVMSVAMHSLEIRELPLHSVRKNHTSVFFILANSMNSILTSIENSTQAILDENSHISEHVDSALRILLYVASGSLFVSICLIFPVATKVDKNKDELLRNFMLIDRDDVKKQLDKCRLFFNTMHDKEHVTQQNMDDIDEEESKQDEEGKNEGEGEEQTKQYKHQKRRKNKMHKKYSSNFLSLIIKFIVVLTVLEGYFLLSYFMSLSFLSKINDLILESGTITKRQFSNNFLYEVIQEVLTTNGTALITSENSLQYIFGFLNDTIKEQEAFLKEHSKNAHYHSKTFNAFFDSLIY